MAYCLSPPSLLRDSICIRPSLPISPMMSVARGNLVAIFGPQISAKNPNSHSVIWLLASLLESSQFRRSSSYSLSFLKTTCMYLSLCIQQPQTLCCPLDRTKRKGNFSHTCTGQKKYVPVEFYSTKHECRCVLFLLKEWSWSV